mgnify:CR=1 FL=1
MLASANLWAAQTDPSSLTVQATFSGRVSRLNSPAGLMRIRLEYKNAKFLNRGDRVEFWNESHPEQRCVSVVEGRSNLHLLLRIPEYGTCVQRIHFTTGSYLHFWSKDLENNLRAAHELIEILLKKRMALLARKRHHQRDLDAHVEKVEAINKRYEVLRQKLEAEWAKDLAAQEEDRSVSLVAFKQAEARLNEVESKLEAYRIHEHNFTVDRWALDPDLYIQK